jgi:L-fuconolactonase
MFDEIREAAVWMIDTHVHLWDLKRRSQPWTRRFPALQRSFWLDDLAELADHHRVDGFVVVQAGDTLGETLELLQLAAESPLIVGVIGWVNLESADIGAQIAQLRLAPGGDTLVGVRHQLQVERDQAWIARPAVRGGLRVLAQAGLSYDIVCAPEQLPTVLSTVEKVPELRFVLDHAGKPPIASGELERWREDLAQLAACPNVAVKLSGLVTEADWTHWTQAQLEPVIDHVLACFGPERTMVGSDWPVCLLAATYGEVLETLAPCLGELPENEVEDLLDKTAWRWYRGPRL